MSKNEFFNIPESELKKYRVESPKSGMIKTALTNITHVLTGKKEKDQEVADAKNPFGIKKLPLEGVTYYPGDIVKLFNGIDKKQLESYKKICKINNVDIKTLKTEGVIFDKLVDFQESLPIFVETHENGSYRLEHKTQTPGPNDTRIKWFDIIQTKDGEKKEIEKNAEVKFKILFDNIVCLEVKSHGWEDNLLIPIKSISQEKKSENVLRSENPILSAIETRLSASKNKKVIERAKLYIKLFTSASNAQIAEMDLMDRQGDLLDLIDGNADEGVKHRYEGWEQKDFLDLYTILYGEK